MGEEKKIIVEHYPAAKLPEELRRGLETGQMVRVTVEAEAEPAVSKRSLTSFVGAAKGIYPTPEDALEAIRALRDEWE